MKKGDLLYPKAKPTCVQLHSPFWGNSVALVVGFDLYADCDFDEQTPLQERERWIILESGELLFMTTYLVEKLYEKR